MSSVNAQELLRVKRDARKLVNRAIPSIGACADESKLVIALASTLQSHTVHRCYAVINDRKSGAGRASRQIHNMEFVVARYCIAHVVSDMARSKRVEKISTDDGTTTIRRLRYDERGFFSEHGGAFSG